MALLPDAVVLFLIFHFLCLFLGQDLALVPDLMAGATALVAAAMKGKSSYCSSCVWTDLQSMHQSNFMICFPHSFSGGTVHLHTQNAEAGKLCYQATVLFLPVLIAVFLLAAIFL